MDAFANGIYLPPELQDQEGELWMIKARSSEFGYWHLFQLGARKSLCGKQPIRYNEGRPTGNQAAQRFNGFDVELGEWCDKCVDLYGNAQVTETELEEALEQLRNERVIR